MLTFLSHLLFFFAWDFILWCWNYLHCLVIKHNFTGYFDIQGDEDEDEPGPSKPEVPEVPKVDDKISPLELFINLYYFIFFSRGIKKVPFPFPISMQHYVRPFPSNLPKQ